VVTAERVWSALAEIPDPEIPTISIVDLGVVRDVAVENGTVRVEFTPTFLGCPALEVMRDQMAARIRELGAEPEVEVILDDSWSTDRITPEGRKKLRASGFAPPSPRQAGHFEDFRLPYEKNMNVISALMEIPVIHIFTHDSIGVGEDGPTHQPVEQLVSLRAIPGLITLRPADANETVEAWRVITPLRHQPVALILTRQAVPTIDRTKYASADGVRRGAYVLADSGDGLPDVILLATGSEVSLCLAAYEQLNAEGIKARVVSMPSWELFEQHCRTSPAYRTEVLPESVTARVSVEKGSTLGWARYVGTEGQSIGMETFGASAPLQELQKKFGFTVENVVAAAKSQVARTR